MLKERRFWVGILVSLGFLFLFFYRTDFSQMMSAIKGASYVYLLPALALYFLAVWFRTVRWHYLLAPLGRLAPRRLFSVVVIGYMANDILPLRLGELVRAYILGEREGMSKLAIIGTIVVERLFDGLTLIFFMAGIALFIPLGAWLGGLLRVMAAIFLGAFVMFLVVASSPSRIARGVELFVRILPLPLKERFRGWLGRFLEGLSVLQSAPRVSLVFLTSVVVWLLEAGMYYVLVYSFNFRQPFYVLLLATSAANLAITLPSTQGGIGPFEWAAKTVLTLFGVEAASATAYVIVLHAALLLPVTLLGFFYLWRENLSLAEVARRRRAKELAPDYGLGQASSQGGGD